MSEYVVSLSWQLGEREFAPGKYSPTHTAAFSPHTELTMSAAPEYGGDQAYANPEQTLAVALSSCHMMTFLALAAKMKWQLTSYSDRAVATLGKLPDGRVRIAAIELNPSVTFAEGAAVDPDGLRQMHDRAHRYCFVANSLDVEMTVNIG